MIVHQLATILLFVIISLVASNENEERKSSDHKLEAITRQIMLQQFFAEQRVRAEGQSGVNLIRLRRSGTKNYFSETHTGGSANAIHDHSNNIRTVGMGEITAVMNGVEFATRHNDYRLYMPSTTSTKNGATEPIPLPEVPPEVTNKTNIDDQVKEMREWLKAWRDQDHSKRDYRKYFKPILCYLEGAWTKTGTNVDEPFTSDRHFIDAKTWMELHDKLRFTAYTGTKSIKENLSFLPTKIINIINGTIPEFAQWNYRILCHPLKNHLPLNRLRVVEDLSSRMMINRDINRHLHSRGARFQLNAKNIDKFFDRPLGRNFLDDLMEEIPGKNNYQGQLYDEGLDVEVLSQDMLKKDVSRYHRWYKTEGRDAMGTSNIHRGYNDDYMFAAMTTQPNVAGMTVKKCKKIRQKIRPFRKTVCHSLTQKWTYAIPLEIIYLTPLSSWNPYKLKYHGVNFYKSPARLNGRNGNCNATLGKEYNGTNSKIYYNTPSEFYTGGNVGKTKADTTRNSVCVLDQNGVQRKVRASGVHVFLPTISGVGVLRQRYPIFPVHGEGSSVWKELNALRDIVLDVKSHQEMKWNYETVGISRATSNDTEFEMSYSTYKAARHTHFITLTPDEVSQCKGGRTVHVTTSSAIGHEHALQVKYNAYKKQFYYGVCDGKGYCWDKHPRFFNDVNA